MNKRADSGVYIRLIIFAVAFVVIAFTAIGARLFHLQVTEYETYSAKAKTQQTRDKTITPARGSILDVNMKPLAMSASTEMVTIEAVKIKTDEEAKAIAENISAILEMDYDTVLEKALSKTTYAVLKKGVEKEKADQIRAFVDEIDTTAIYLIPDSTRYYPFGSFASHIIGFVGSDQQGLDGIEALYEDYMEGTPGRLVTATNVNGDEMPFSYETYVDAVDGYNVVLTIDEVIQHYVEQNLKEAYEQNDVQKYAASIVMDVETGGILAMASYPEYDPNDPFTIGSEKTQAYLDTLEGEEKETQFKKELQSQWRNKIVSDSYNPGSTFKIITAAMALEEKTIPDGWTFNCTGSIMVPGWSKPIKCWKHEGHGVQTFEQAVENSCNPAFITIGKTLGVKQFSKYFEAFGLTEKTGIDVSGEEKGIYYNVDKMTEVDLAVSSFGQGFQITPIQLLTAVSAVANDGYLMRPHLVKEVRDAEGNIVESFEQEPLRQVVSEKTSEKLMSVLQGVVANGTGKNAYVPGFRVGGKTGTSEKKLQQAQTGELEYITSFVAVAPVDDPKIAVIVILDEPQSYPISGGVQAAPVVRKIIEETLPYLEVEPIYTEEELKAKDTNVPELTGLTEAEAAADLAEQGFTTYRVVGEGETVTDQMPFAGSAVPPVTEVVLYMGEAKPDRMVTVPDLTGYTYAMAKQTLENSGLYISTGGIVPNKNHVVRGQSVDALAQVPYGSTIIIELSDKSQNAAT